MRQFLFVGVVAACVITGCQRTSPIPLSPEELDAVRAVGRAQQAAINAEDVDRIVALYAPDAVSLPPGWEALQGHEAIRHFWEGQVTGVQGTGSYTTMVVYGENDVAYEAGTYTYAYTDAAGVALTRHGKFLVVLRRQADGSWKIAADMWNLTPSPGPPPGSEQSPNWQ
jgi:uncharacterized protein (TIGR02246 family)